MIRAAIFLLAVSASLFSSCKDTPGSPPDPGDNPAAGSETSEKNGPVALLPYQVLNVYPHDTTSYTEGLLVQDGELYESTGHTPEISYTRSLFGIVDPKTGRIGVKAELD